MSEKSRENSSQDDPYGLKARGGPIGTCFKCGNIHPAKRRCSTDG